MAHAIGISDAYFRRVHSGSAEKNSPEGITDRLADLQRQLEENESQRAEIGGYINQLNIQLHRWQLRLQTLNERNEILRAELDSLAEPSDLSLR